MSVEKRARKLVGKVRCPRTFQPAHPLVTKLLGQDEIRRQERLKWSWSDGPLYEAGTERRRLLIINALFMAAARLQTLDQHLEKSHIRPAERKTVAEDGARITVLDVAHS